MGGKQSTGPLLIPGGVLAWTPWGKDGKKGALSGNLIIPLLMDIRFLAIAKVLAAV